MTRRGVEIDDRDVEGPRAIRPPVAWLWVAGGATGLAAALTLVDGLAAAIVGYALASFVTMSCVAAFRIKDRRAKLDPFYAPQPALEWIARILLTLGLVVTVMHVLTIAFEVARQ